MQTITSRRLPLLAGIAVLTALTLSACAPSGAAPDAAPTSPLQPYLDAAYGGALDSDEERKRLAAEDEKREALIADCMTVEGFDYTPDPQPAELPDYSGPEWKPDSREWVAQYGYGLFRAPEGGDASALPQGPNEKYVASLTESEQAAYFQALYGTDEKATGCVGEADAQLSTGQNPVITEFAPLLEEIDQLYADLPGAPEFAELDADWASCMTDAGLPGYTVQGDAQNEVNESLIAFTAKNPDESATDTPEYRSLAEDEVELALADLECRTSTHYSTRYDAAVREVEERFVTDHKTELEALEAAAEQGK